jgi:hypothetical protein
MVTEEHLDKWIAALRSGDYRQGRHSLAKRDPVTNEVCHCCLSVLTQACPDIKDPKSVTNPEYHLMGVGYPKDTNWNHDHETGFVSKNDAEGWSFERIADYIEENKEHLVSP